VTKSRNVWAKPGIKVIGPASFKSQTALPYQKMPLWCLARVTHLHRFRERGNQPISSDSVQNTERFAKIANSSAVWKDAVFVVWCLAHWSRDDDWRLVGKCIVTKSGRNVWAKPGIKVIGPASFKSQTALPYQKMPLWCLARACDSARPTPPKVDLHSTNFCVKYTGILMIFKDWDWCWFEFRCQSNHMLLRRICDA
jgi:hypothetical protein